MKISKFLLIASTGIIAASCANFGKKSEQTVQQETVIPNVATAVAELRDVPQSSMYSSTVEAYVTNNIAPQSGGRIRRILVDVGDMVSAGQIVAEMDKVNLNQQKLQLINDSTELSRIRGLYEVGGVAKSDLEAMELAYNVRKSAYENLVENTVLRSPINGVITARNYDKGDMYAMAQPLYVVQQIVPVKMYVGISEAEYTKVKKGDKVSLTVDAIPGREFEGKINRIYPIIDAATHTFKAEVVVSNTDRVLRPGMYARVTVTFGINNSIVVPDIAVFKQEGSGDRFVYVLNSDNTVSLKKVKPGLHKDFEIEILEGLSEGDMVVTKGHGALKDGIKVNVQ